jgi:hypothetical protein
MMRRTGERVKPKAFHGEQDKSPRLDCSGEERRRGPEALSASYATKARMPKAILACKENSATAARYQIQCAAATGSSATPK